MIVRDNARPAESGHWYTKDGEPMYEIVGKNGKLRATTLRDAKSNGLVPSVTTIIGQLNKPALVAWAQQQVLLASLTLPRLPNEPEDAYIARIMQDAKEESRKAADRGTAVHAGIQGFFEGNPVPEYQKHYENVSEELKKAFGDRNWISEKAFASDTAFQFGGKVDLHSPSLHGGDNGFVVDIKTKDKDLDKAEPYWEHILQLSAYRNGLGIDCARCAIVFVNSVTGESKLCEIDDGDLVNAWSCFQNLAHYYYTKNNL